MKVRCRTNLDLCHCEVWPTDLPAVPSVGDEVESGHHWKREHYDLHLSLQVVRVRWVVCRDPRSYDGGCMRLPEVELHLNPQRFKTITDFYEWYGRVCGRGKSAFI